MQAHPNLGSRQNTPKSTKHPEKSSSSSTETKVSEKKGEPPPDCRGFSCTPWPSNALEKSITIPPSISSKLTEHGKPDVRATTPRTTTAKQVLNKASNKSPTDDNTTKKRKYVWMDPTVPSAKQAQNTEQRRTQGSPFAPRTRTPILQSQEKPLLKSKDRLKPSQRKQEKVPQPSEMPSLKPTIFSPNTDKQPSAFGAVPLPENAISDANAQNTGTIGPPNSAEAASAEKALDVNYEGKPPTSNVTVKEVPRLPSSETERKRFESDTGPSVVTSHKSHDMPMKLPRESEKPQTQLPVSSDYQQATEMPPATAKKSNNDLRDNPPPILNNDSGRRVETKPIRKALDDVAKSYENSGSNSERQHSQNSVLSRAVATDNPVAPFRTDATSYANPPKQVKQATQETTQRQDSGVHTEPRLHASTAYDSFLVTPQENVPVKGNYNSRNIPLDSKAKENVLPVDRRIGSEKIIQRGGDISNHLVSVQQNDVPLRSSDRIQRPTRNQISGMQRNSYTIDEGYSSAASHDRQYGNMPNNADGTKKQFVEVHSNPIRTTGQLKNPQEYVVESRPRFDATPVKPYTVYVVASKEPEKHIQILRAIPSEIVTQAPIAYGEHEKYILVGPERAVLKVRPVFDQKPDHESFRISGSERQITLSQLPDNAVLLRTPVADPKMREAAENNHEVSRIHSQYTEHLQTNRERNGNRIFYEPRMIPQTEVSQSRNGPVYLIEKKPEAALEPKVTLDLAQALMPAKYTSEHSKAVVMGKIIESDPNELRVIKTLEIPNPGHDMHRNWRDDYRPRYRDNFIPKSYNEKAAYPQHADESDYTAALRKKELDDWLAQNARRTNGATRDFVAMKEQGQGNEDIEQYLMQYHDWFNKYKKPFLPNGPNTEEQFEVDAPRIMSKRSLEPENEFHRSVVRMPAQEQKPQDYWQLVAVSRNVRHETRQKKLGLRENEYDNDAVEGKFEF